MKYLTHAEYEAVAKTTASPSIVAAKFNTSRAHICKIRRRIKETGSPHPAHPHILSDEVERMVAYDAGADDAIEQTYHIGTKKLHAIRKKYGTERPPWLPRKPNPVDFDVVTPWHLEESIMKVRKDTAPTLMQRIDSLIDALVERRIKELLDNK